MGDAFDAASLDRRYAFLDGLPESLLPALITLPLGALEQRAAGVRRWREELLQGRLPAPGDWPPPAVAAPILRALDELGLSRFCAGQPELVDALLADLLEAVRRQSLALEEEVRSKLRELEQLARRRQAGRAPARKRPGPRPSRLPADVLARLAATARGVVEQRDRGRDRELVAAWGERARAWAALAEVLGDLGALLGRGWDLAAGVLRHGGWADLVRLHGLVAQLPALRALVRALGRLQLGEGEPSVAERVVAPMRRVGSELRETRAPFVPSETRGVERSGELARMLPGEGALLGHPRLRLLWHARRAERALLTYLVEGVVTEQVPVEGLEEQPVPARAPLERGPIIAVIDTSGSMHGLPEAIAKALVLEAVRTAHAERRRCLLYAYGGPGEVVELELELSPEGIGRLLEFLTWTFGGGTDVTTVLQRVLDRLRAERWRTADVLFVSDGEWSLPDELAPPVREARDGKTRFHGVRIGNRGHTGLHDLCDPIHVFADWAQCSIGSR